MALAFRRLTAATPGGFVIFLILRCAPARGGSSSIALVSIPPPDNEAIDTSVPIFDRRWQPMLVGRVSHHLTASILARELVTARCSGISM